MRKLILLALVVVATSCVTERRCNRRYPPQVTDSIYINSVSVIRDTTILFQIHSDTIRAVTPSKFSYLSNKYSYTTARIDSGLLYHELFTIKQSIPIRIDSVIRYVKKTEYKDRERVVTERYTPKWVKLFAGLGIGSLALFLLYIVIKLT